MRVCASRPDWQCGPHWAAPVVSCPARWCGPPESAPSPTRGPQCAGCSVKRKNKQSKLISNQKVVCYWNSKHTTSISVLECPMLQRTAAFFMTFMCDRRMTFLLPVAVMTMSTFSMTSSTVTTRKPSMLSELNKKLIKGVAFGLSSFTKLELRRWDQFRQCRRWFRRLSVPTRSPFPPLRSHKLERNDRQAECRRCVLA